MSIARLKKLSVIGCAADKDATLARLQELGAMHILALSPPETHVEKKVSREAEDAYKALRFLAVVPGQRRQVRIAPDFDVEYFVAEALILKDKLRTAQDRRDFLVDRIATIQPWGDFTFPPTEALAELRLWFYELPLKNRDSLQAVDLPWQIVGRDHRVLYVAVVSADEPRSDLLPVPRTHLGAKPITVLQDELEDAEIEIETLLGERMALTRFLTLLRSSLSKAETAAELAFAETQTFDDPDLFAIQGWVPEDRIAALQEICADEGLAVLISAPQPGEVPPTLIEQPDAEAAGVDLALFYQVPNYYAWDPSRVLIASFSVFFAMIIADAGYGFLILLGVLAFWRRLGATAHTRAWRTMLLILAGATVAYGVIVGSYFGVGPPEGGILARLKLMDINDFTTMMRLSIIVGVAHVGFANLMAFLHKSNRSRYANLGWICVVLGGLAVWLSGQTGPVYQGGLGSMTLGLFVILLFSSDRPVKSGIDWLWRLIGGVQSLAGLMGLFGDVLSYMRLFALGLASASLAVTFNGLAAKGFESASGLGLLGGLLILLIGHGLNFTLAIMSGVVHGLRLNFIEFYKWGLPEEGTVFRAFSRKEVQE
ncbi:V-type ATP synthase subunit I [Ruegeria hyattellae]|uniref:V-type ATP synthase subunit I n=1 Tax=Ruegeria hyattellae TaxID=3233337 RepID=UPI00355BC90D